MSLKISGIIIHTPTSYKKITYTVLFFIILFSITIGISIRISPYSSQSIITYDLIRNLIVAKKFTYDHRINQIGFFTWNSKWVYDPKPIGFPILLAEFSTMSSISIYGSGYLFILFYILEIVLIFILAQKLFHNRSLSLVAAFLMATYLTGPANQGPLYTHYANIDLILFLFIITILFSMFNLMRKIILLSLSFSGIMITHRPGLIFIFIFGSFLLLYSVLEFFIRKNSYTFKRYVTIYLVGFIFGWDIAAVYWLNIKLENILLFGYSPFTIKIGFLPPVFLDLLKLVNYPLYLSILIFANFISILLVLNIYKRGIPEKKVDGISTYTLKRSYFLIIMFILPLFFGISVIYIGVSMGIIYQGNVFKYFLDVWMAFAKESYEIDTIKILKQIFYIWHWNFLALFFMMPGLYHIFHNLKKNPQSAMLGILLIFTLPIIWISQIYMSYTTVIERIYLYLAPFAYIVASFGICKYINLKPTKWPLKKIWSIFLIILIVGTAGSYVVYSTSFKYPQYTDKQIEIFLFNKYKISNNFIITGEGKDINRGVLYDYERYKQIDPFWGTHTQSITIARARQKGVSYIYSNLSPGFLELYSNPKYLDFDGYCWKVYSTNNRSIYYIG